MRAEMDAAAAAAGPAVTPVTSILDTVTVGEGDSYESNLGLT